MKRLFAIILAGLLVFTVVGCSDTQQTESVQSDASSVATETSSTEQTVLSEQVTSSENNAVISTPVDSSNTATEEKPRPLSKQEEMRQYIENALKTYKPLTYEKKPLSDEMINKIKTDYIKACKKTDEWTVDDIRLETPTAYGDAYRMQIGYAAKDGSGGFGPSITVMHPFTVFGYRLYIDHGAYHRTRIYKDGRFYQLKEACEEEILDRKYIVDIIVKNAVDQNFKNKYLGQ